MSIDYESLKDKAVVIAQSGVTRAKEFTETGIAKAKELADTGVAKAKELAEIGKLKVSNSTEQEAVRKAYSELGKLYFAERGSAPEPAYADACQRITDSLARIAYNNERIADIKAAGHLTDEEVEEVPAEEPSCCCEEKKDEEAPSCCCEQSKDEDEPQE